jgi:hypothetical protein
MTYSNTNKDKIQSGWWNRLKLLILTGGLLTLLLSSGLNIYRQWTTLRKAEDRNKSMEDKLEKLEEENRHLKAKIEIATTSAYIDRKYREFFGMGGKDDYWLIIPKDSTESSLKREITVVDDEPNIIKWWNLFIK